ncbi:hypothetical protein KL921_003560 [Ogataea angusta]|uniref:Small ribosomal subunit protein mS35 mitochondrial conserved domain-containing protein n=1 Tax=Pichia angusta TaxID=870730 RepID=A0AAN6DGQ8_PICAN|nr:uncharacterized protein KL928_003797 [Ogataea angusta]KAG7809563.1 hypothetical protein KL921_003560 [Ogataea angusta]KAG7817008.1 hypothetical protein KL909_005359 [Ogataea angusta]KAG7817898.1 hypothetical protein KL928_003797 [Ogataea angusta]KAG7826712.1 hypothetical protein KL920_005314 [Ogataea angusta]KAG7833495.1 hypothetical protein KL943_003603 [Ogataea angusta]
MFGRLLRPSARHFSGVRPTLNASSALEAIDNRMKKLQREAQLSPEDNSLLNRPDLWQGLPDQKVLELYQQRKINLGKHYRRNRDEFSALVAAAPDIHTAYMTAHAYTAEEGDMFRNQLNYQSKMYHYKGNFMSDEIEEDEYDEYPTEVQEVVDNFRDHLEFNRVAAYELPLLTKYRKEYVPPKKGEKPVTYRYTKYFGESHPAERKVSVSVKVSELDLTREQKHKFKLLAGVRYDHERDIFKMSSDRYLEPAQNASFLSEVMDDLVAEAKRDAHKYADVPLDKRHTKAKARKKQHRKKRVYEFPKEWERPIAPESKQVDWQQMLTE